MGDSRLPALKTFSLEVNVQVWHHTEAGLLPASPEQIPPPVVLALAKLHQAVASCMVQEGPITLSVDIEVANGG